MNGIKLISILLRQNSAAATQKRTHKTTISVDLHKSETPLICRSRQFVKTLSNCILIRNPRVIEVFEVKGDETNVNLFILGSHRYKNL